jgi:hypothetical protein
MVTLTSALPLEEPDIAKLWPPRSPLRDTELLEVPRMPTTIRCFRL